MCTVSCKPSTASLHVWHQNGVKVRFPLLVSLVFTYKLWHLWWSKTWTSWLNLASVRSSYWHRPCHKMKEKITPKYEGERRERMHVWNLKTWEWCLGKLFFWSAFFVLTPIISWELKQGERFNPAALSEIHLPSCITSTLTVGYSLALACIKINRQSQYLYLWQMAQKEGYFCSIFLQHAHELPPA